MQGSKYIDQLDLSFKVKSSYLVYYPKLRLKNTKDIFNNIIEGRVVKIKELLY